MDNPTYRVASILKIQPETADTSSYEFALEDGQELQFLPGQFNMLGFFGIGEAAVSLSSDPGSGGPFQHTVRAVSDVTNAMARLQAGDVVGLRGPFGNSWPMEEAVGQDLLIAGGGIGLAPLRAAIEQALRERDRYGSIVVLYGAKTPDELIFTADFDRWSAQPDTCLHLTVDRTLEQPWPHHIGVVPALCGLVTLDPARTTVLMCGPEVMMRFTALDLLKRGYHAERLFLSFERRMRCGVAQCGHCFLGPKFVCQDGPVFRYPDLEGLWGKGV